ncbi:MAG: hypothetical protein ACOX2E_11675 [Syntrophaceticus sp.]|jgi:Ca2+/Na+ antiporter
MVAILPILIILLLVVLLVVRRSSFSLRNNIQFWLIAGYILLLLVSPVIIKLLPVENLADEKMKTVSGKDIAEAMFSERDLYELAIEGRPEQVEGAFVLKQWEFPFNGSLLNVADCFEYEGGAIIAEKKDRADGKVEVIDYATKTIVDQFDFSEEMMPHKVALDGNILKISRPERQEVRLAMFSRGICGQPNIG